MSRLTCEQLIEKDKEVRACMNKATWVVMFKGQVSEHLCDLHKRKEEAQNITTISFVRME